MVILMRLQEVCCCEKLSSDRGMDIVFVSFCAQELHKIKPVNHSSMDGGEAHEVHP